MLERKDELFYISTEITGEYEMVPVEMQDALAIKELLDKDDIEELLVSICEKNDIYMDMVNDCMDKDESFIDTIISKVVKKRDKLLSGLISEIAENELALAYEKNRYNKLAAQFDVNKQELDLDEIFGDDEI